MHKEKEHFKLNIAFIYGIIFLIVGFALQAYKFSFTKSVYGEITGITNTECIISMDSGTKEYRAARAIGDILSGGKIQKHANYGKQFHFKYEVNNTEYYGDTECTNKYNLNDKIKIFYNKNNPNNIITNSNINSYFIIALIWGIIFIIMGFSSDLKNKA